MLSAVGGNQASTAATTADDVEQFRGDHFLARLVQFQGEVVHQFQGVVRGVLHGNHARRVLTGDGLQNRVVDHRLHVAGHEFLQHCSRGGLIYEPGRVRMAISGSAFGWLDRQQSFHDGSLYCGVDEFAVGDEHAVRFGVLELVHDHARDADCFFQAWAVADAERGLERLPSPDHKGLALAADGYHFDGRFRGLYDPRLPYVECCRPTLRTVRGPA